jgi:DNA-directed RNA polymerase III subunit RPC11
LISPVPAYQYSQALEMLFCPFCGVLLLLDRQTTLAYCCPTCTFISPLRAAAVHTVDITPLNKPAPDEDDFASACEEQGGQKTTIPCPGSSVADSLAAGGALTECEGTTAMYVQVQMRSADEPPTTFYRCTTCGTKWKTD